jgi:hypothetical protein
MASDPNFSQTLVCTSLVLIWFRSPASTVSPPFLEPQLCCSTDVSFCSWRHGLHGRPLLTRRGFDKQNKFQNMIVDIVPMTNSVQVYWNQHSPIPLWPFLQTLR